MHSKNPPLAFILSVAYLTAMTHYEFKLLDEAKQAELLWDKGVHLMEREDHIFKYILYQIDAFYVEVWFHKELNAIQLLKSFGSITPLTP